MSSTNDGSDEGSREDELDLGQHDEDLPNPVTARDERGVEEELTRSDGPDGFHLEDERDTVAVEDQEHDYPDEETPHVSGPVPGTPEELSSIPDDTPSLHVSGATKDNCAGFFFFKFFMLMDSGIFAVVNFRQRSSLSIIHQI